MTATQDFFYLAAEYHRSLPDRIREYLNARGIPDAEIDLRILGWNGARITIPVFNRKGVCASFRLGKDPDEQGATPKMVSLPGSSAELYGWEVMRLRPERVIVCEGEFDRLVLEANGFDAVTSTGGAGTFLREWAEAFAEVPEVYICFDRDEPGNKGAFRVAGMIPRAKIVALPEEVGESGDITDFFVRLGKTKEDFAALLRDAQPLPQLAQDDDKPSPPPVPKRGPSSLRAEIERIKRDVRIDDVVDCYLQLRKVGKAYVGRCPLHQDRNPSFTVYPDQGTFHCYGCGAHGDAITFLQQVEHLGFKQALHTLDQFRSNHEPSPE